MVGDRAPQAGLPPRRGSIPVAAPAPCAAAFPPCARPILTEIYLRHACSCHEMLSGHAAAGHKSWALCTFDSPAAAQVCMIRTEDSMSETPGESQSPAIVVS
eukprot:COSAG01_NODE_16_length_40091_cov_15.728646_48_plen_102_part_00